MTREEAIKQLNGYVKLSISAFPKDLEALDMAIEALNQQKEYEWIDDNENELDAQYGRHLYKCSKCNKYANDFVGGIEDWWDVEKPNYCPNCGAKMKVRVSE